MVFYDLPNNGQSDTGAAVCLAIVESEEHFKDVICLCLLKANAIACHLNDIVWSSTVLLFFSHDGYYRRLVCFTIL